MSSNHSHTVHIDKLVYGGDGLARLPSGEVVFVPGGVPADDLQVTVLPSSKKPLKAVVSNILKPSPQRTEPACSVFGTCGGCQWQHIEISAQQEWKQQIVRESLERVGKISSPPILPILSPSPKVATYRNRVQWVVVRQSDGTFRVGYRENNQHCGVAFKNCTIISPAMNQLAQTLNDSFQQYSAVAEAIERIEVFASPANMFLITIESQASDAFFTDWIHQVTQQNPSLVGIQRKSGAHHSSHSLWGKDHLTFSLLNKSYQVSADSFFQTTYPGTERLVETVGQFLPTQGDSLLDVYAGVGLFSLQFAERFQHVLGIESSPSASQDATCNIQANQFSNIKWLSANAESALKQIDTAYAVGVVDPPRSGCHPAVLQALSQHIQTQLIYVSCNPTTLARDLQRLLAAGWYLQQVQPIDLFPQTYHVETVAQLTR